MRGRAVPIPWSRRLMADAMAIAMDTPSVAIKRMMSLGPAVAARKSSPDRVPWSAIMTKGFAMTAQDFPELRRVYLKYPYPHFYQYPASVAAITVEREDGGENHIVNLLIKNPAALPLAEIARRIEHARTGPIRDIKEFAIAMRFARLPHLLRRSLWRLAFLFGRSRARFFGTFGMAAIPSTATEVLQARTTWTAFVSYAYGSLNEDGMLTMPMTWDHRVFDAATAGRILARFEELLNGPIADELRS